MRTTVYLILLLVSAATARADDDQNSNKMKNVYVWDFVTRDQTPESRSRALVDKLTEEFELALARLAREEFTVLERRGFARLKAHIDNEDAIASIAGLPEKVQDRLRGLRADIVVFGMVTDDIDSGELLVTVTFQEFNGRKFLIQRFRLPRGRAFDVEARQKAMDGLVSAVAGAVGRESGGEDRDIAVERPESWRVARIIILPPPPPPMILTDPGLRREAVATDGATADGLQATWLPWAAVGVGLATMLSGTLLRWQAKNDFDAADTSLNELCATGCEGVPLEIVSRISRGEARQRLALVAHVAGGLALANGVVFLGWRRWKHRRARGRTLSIRPKLSPGSVSATVQLSF